MRKTASQHHFVVVSAFGPVLLQTANNPQPHLIPRPTLFFIIRFARKWKSSKKKTQNHGRPGRTHHVSEHRWIWGGGGKGVDKESVEDGESSFLPCCDMLAAEFCGQHRVYQAQCRTPLEYFYLIRYTLLQPYYILNWQICKFSWWSCFSTGKSHTVFRLWLMANFHSLLHCRKHMCYTCIHTPTVCTCITHTCLTHTCLTHIRTRIYVHMYVNTQPIECKHRCIGDSSQP